MTNNDTTPRVWIGCLGCYNDGHLVGEWFDATDAPIDMNEWNETAPPWRGWQGPAFGPHRRHITEGHEELWVMDHANFRGLLKGECSPIEAKCLADLLESVEAEGYDVAAFAAWADNEGIDLSGDWSELRDSFAEAWAGEWDSVEEFAQNLAEDLGFNPGGQGWPLSCIDWSHAYRELRIGGDYYDVTVNGRLFVFRNV